MINALHILAIGATVTSVLLMDLRILGLASFAAREPFLRVMRNTVAVAFPVALASGLALFSIRAQEYAFNPAFLAKMALLIVAGLNLLAFRGVARSMSADAAYPPTARFLAGFSIMLWVSILVAGRFIGFL